MADYIRSWLKPAVPVPQINTQEPDAEDDNITITGDDEEDDSPPAFPALNSAQRASGRATDAQLMPPPSMLALPLSTTKVPAKPSKKREKVALAPGHGALDWANLKNSGQDLRGVDTLMRIPPSLLKQHNKRDDAWTAIYGKVYNITAYMPFHPGGERELMRCAGRDGTKLFAETHGWVNADFMLDNCMVGFLVAERTD